LLHSPARWTICEASIWWCSLAHHADGGLEATSFQNTSVLPQRGLPKKNFVLWIYLVLKACTLGDPTIIPC
jgi:hypothetical protein